MKKLQNLARLEKHLNYLMISMIHTGKTGIKNVIALQKKIDTYTHKINHIRQSMSV